MTDERTEDRPAQAGPPSRCEFSAREGAPLPHSNSVRCAMDSCCEHIPRPTPFALPALAMRLPVELLRTRLRGEGGGRRPP
eukprot:gene11352-biopygen3569